MSHDRWWFLAWLLIGAAYALGLLGALSIGVFLLPLALLATLLLTRRPGAVHGVPGLIAGVGLAPLLVAYLNRHGPGDVCTSTPTGSSCSEQWSPWPWLAIGIALVVAGTAWFAVRRRAGG